MAAIISRWTTSPSPSASSAVSSASTILTSVKSTKDSDPPTVRFTSTQDLFDFINSTTGDFLAITTTPEVPFSPLQCQFPDLDHHNPNPST
ncbi:hypothetical protein B0T26DRAFT_524504 [Lasiosphaeria miniovina]|uniref:Uncharacterized protein n=1 Tax=Lasiosphaeria miniovina TaxID=1954250 RepID=A0AA39ZQL6_9PEZI|nr:uncharacterized protein B0T26DRAFT_524504 [Lasiosphaeria miniovina]KAK0701625.1 hypothetical protein B0T26DRAFT_524504 [Lasiosphaeria miniovina]